LSAILNAETAQNRCGANWQPSRSVYSHVSYLHLQYVIDANFTTRELILDHKMLRSLQMTVAHATNSVITKLDRLLEGSMGQKFNACMHIHARPSISAGLSK
jgi:hypothetical protein